ncbi:MAG: hypothetical protein JWQ35_589 [Bacteriovoracaceae bacterium]|nr:hypothetical protein [Bacteriovoracaceae bacterium]
MRIVLWILVFSFPLSLFSWNFGGLEFYPAFLLIPFGFLQLFERLKENANYRMSHFSFGILLLAILILFHAAAQSFLASDILKLIVAILLYNSLIFLSKRLGLKILNILDYSICLLVLYGIFQIVASLSGYRELASSFNTWVRGAGEAIPIDTRGVGILDFMRVSSFTSEPSYFAFTVCVYFFLTESRITRFFCLIGIFISLSFITLYSWTGMAVYQLTKKLRVPTPFFFIGAVIAHLIFAATIYYEVPQKFFPTFYDRYAGIVEFLRFDWLQILFGSNNIDRSFPINLIRPYSNLGSILFLFGLLGLSIYIFLFRALEKEATKPKAVIMIFLLMFNYYYLTSWPIIAGFLFLILQRKPVEDTLVSYEY